MPTAEESGGRRMAEGQSRSFVMKLAVSRSTDLASIRLLVPTIVLVVLSWGGFWIKPSALMPRFASGFDLEAKYEKYNKYIDVKIIE